MSDKQEREYKITKGNLGYHVYRTREHGGIINLERLQRDTYTLNREYARTFYHLSDATSALVLARTKGNTIKLGFGIGKKESEKKPEKTSWSEL